MQRTGQKKSGTRSAHANREALCVCSKSQTTTRGEAMEMRTPGRVPELSNRLLIGIAGTVADQWEKFTGWLVAGLGATLALIVANLDKAKDMLQAPSVSYAIKVFVAILIVHTAQK